MTADDLAVAVGSEAAKELTDALDRIKRCVAQLSDEQLWWRSRPELNSIGNLILHLCGNVRQWIVSGIGGAADARDRPAEFAQRGPIPAVELLRRLDGVVADAAAVLQRLSAEELLRGRTIQGFDVTGLAAVVHSVSHFRGHTQEIIHITRSQLGDDYRFAWTPATPAQGASIRQ